MDSVVCRRLSILATVGGGGGVKYDQEPLAELSFNSHHKTSNIRILLAVQETEIATVSISEEKWGSSEKMSKSNIFF